VAVRITSCQVSELSLGHEHSPKMTATQAAGRRSPSVCSHPAVLIAIR